MIRHNHKYIMARRKSFWSKLLSAGKRALLGDYAKDEKSYRRYTGSTGLTKSRNLGYSDTIRRVKRGRQYSSYERPYKRSRVSLREPPVSRLQKNRYERKFDEGSLPQREVPRRQKKGLISSLIKSAGKLSKVVLPLVEGGLAIQHQQLGRIRERDRWAQEDRWRREDERDRRRWRREEEMDRRSARQRDDDDNRDKQEALQLLARIKGNSIKGEDEETMKGFSPSERLLATEMPTKGVKRKRNVIERRRERSSEEILNDLLASY